MSNKNEKEEIYNLCKEYYDYENYLNYDHDNWKIAFFLIEKELMDKFKKNICYDQLKNSIKKNIDLKNIDKNILNKLTKIKKNIVQTKFNNKQELLNELEKGKIFYMITAKLFNQCKEDKKIEKGIDSLLSKGKVRLFFKEKKEKIDFKYNEDGTIGKSNLVNKDAKNESQKKIVFKEDLEILIELYYYHKILKSKENKSFKELNDDNKETVYLINNNWIENYKSFFEYKDLENELINIDNKNPSEIKDIYITGGFIDKKISSLTDSFIEKINKKNKTNFGKIKCEIIKLQKRDVNYLVNNQIVNYGIYTKLTNFKYFEGDSNVKKCECYFFGNQKILLFFGQGIGKDIDEIGYINNDNVFIPEFLLVYHNNDISVKNLNQFFKINFFNFNLNNQNNICDIFDSNNSKIGQCYKLKTFTENKNQKQSSSREATNSEENESALNEGNSQNNLSDNNSEKNEILSSIDKFNEELSKNVKDSIRDGFIIKDDECYLVRKDWLDKFKNNNNSDKNCILKDSLSNLSSFNHNIFYINDFYIINRDIYQKLCEKNFINKDENNTPTKYIINNGKLILEHDFKINITFYNLLICRQNENNSFSTEIIIHFEDNKNERDKEFENLKNNKNTQYNTEKCKTFDTNLQVGLFKPINEIKEKKEKIERDKRIKYIEIMASLYFHNEELKNKTTRPLKGSKIENYFIINKKWMDKFIEKFKYNKFYEIIKSKRNEILNNNKNAQFSFEDKISDEILEKIDKLIENESFINDIIKAEKLLEELSNKELYSSKIDNIEDTSNNISIINEGIKNLIKEIFKIECEEKHEFILGNEKIYIKFKTKDQNYIIDGKLKTSDYNYSFEKESSINFNENKNQIDESFNNYIKNGNEISNNEDELKKKEEARIGMNIHSINSLNPGNGNPNKLFSTNNEPKENPLVDEQNRNIQNDKSQTNNNNKNDVKYDIDNTNHDKNKNDINHNLDNINNNNNESNSSNNVNNGINNNNKNNMKKVNATNNNENTNFNNTNDLAKRNNNFTIDITKDMEKFNNNNLNNKENSQIKNDSNKNENQSGSNVKKKISNNDIKKEEIKLEKFTKKQIKILILYYLFIEELKENIELSKTSNECYLIHKNYMKEYKDFYLYNELVQEIKKILLSYNDIRNNNTNKEEIIFNKLDNEYLKKIKTNENKYPKDILDNKEKAQARFNKDQNLQYPVSFEIINKNIYEMIKERKDNKAFNFGKKEYLINESKIILKLDYPDKNIYEIIVGTIDKTDNTFISNYLYKYNEQNGMNSHYDYLTIRTFTIFKLNNISQTNQKILLEDINNNNNKDRKIGIIYVLNEIKEEQKDNNPAQQLLSNENNNQIVNNEPEKELKLNQQIINNIKFLTGFYLFNKDIKNQIIESNSSHKGYEKGYMINEKLFKIYLKFYDYNKLKDFLTKYDKIKLSIDKSKNLLHDENIEKISSELIKNISKDLKEKYINGFNEFNELLKNNELYSATLKRYNQMEFLFFDSCILVKENLIKLISIDDPEIQNKINNSKIEFVITDKKIIINYNFILNIGLIDENYIFNPEIIFLCSGEESLKTIKNDIKISGYKNALKKVKIKEKNVATYNSNNSILVLFINEKLITSENNPSTKNVNNETFNPINPKTNIKPKGNQNLISKETSKHDRTKSSEKLKINNGNNSNRYGSIGSATPHEDKKLSSTTKNMLLVLIDSEKIKKKTNFPLSANNNKLNKYYLLNLEWFLYYIKFYNLDNLYNHLINNKIIENIINKDYILSNEKLIENVMPYIDSKYKNPTINNNYFNFVKYENNFKVKYEEVEINKEKKIILYTGFILVSEETIKPLAKEFNFKYNYNSCECCFGDNKIFMKIVNNYQNVIEIGSISNEKNIFTPRYFFNFTNGNSIDNCVSELLRVGYINYKNYYLLFNNDYTSPIFDAKGNIIGDAFTYNHQIKDYSIYQINVQLKSMIKLYLNYSQLRYSGNEIKQREYYLFNEDFLKQYKIDCNYEMIEDALKSNNNITEVFNEKDEINEKKLTVIIKTSLTDINKILNEQETNNNEQNVKDGVPFYDIDNASNLMYYNNFEMINANLIEKSSPLAQSQNNKCTCFLISNYMLIVLPRNLNNNKNNCIVEVGKINNDNIFNASYLMEYKDINIFIKYLQYVNNIFGFETFLETLQFNNDPCITLNDENNHYIGKIYKLGIIANNNNNVQNTFNSKTNNINNNKNNRNNTPSNQNFQNNAQNVQKVPNSNNNNNFFNGKTWNNTGRKGNKVEDITPRINTPISPFKSIKEEFPFHQGIALRNVGATCYMNATLQCLCNIEKLVSYFKYHQTIENYIQNHGKTTLTYSFKYLVENLWQSYGSKYILPKYNGENSNNKYFSPIGFKNKISTMNSLFEGAQANDAKDLVNFIIMTLHEELNKIKKSTDLNKTFRIINQTNHDMVLQYFIKNFSKENKSIISDLFYAMSGTYSQCSKCNEIKYNFQNYFFLIFPLEEVRKFKIKNLTNYNCQNMMLMNPFQFQLQQNQINNIKSVNLDDCFQYNEKMEIFAGENAMFCNRCNGQFQAGYKTRLYYGPEILIIVLNRGKGIEFKVKLEFTERINLSPYFQLKNFGNIYNLIGVVTHMGESGASGHFIANAKSPIDGQWYTYNDDLVYKVDNFKKQIIDYAMPYILFYQKEK